MASSQDPIFGRLSGKIGPVVTYVSNGKQVIRSHVIPKDPKTPKQLAHRMKVGLINKGFSPLNNIIKLGFKNSEKTYRKLVGEAYHSTIIGEYPNLTLDYSKVQVAEGDVQSPVDVTVEISTDDSTDINTAHFNWEKQISVSSQMGRNDDQVNVVCLNQAELYAVNSLNTAPRIAGKASFAIPKGWKIEDIHFWIFLSTSDLQFNSNSIYVTK